MAKQYLKWYENHKAAFLAGKYDYDMLYDFRGVTAREALKSLNEDKTIRFLWECTVLELSITSQLLMSGELFKHISKSAEASLKKKFKDFEVKLLNEIEKTNA